jgi:hypothetical protein
MRTSTELRSLVQGDEDGLVREPAERLPFEA